MSFCLIFIPSLYFYSFFLVILYLMNVRVARFVFSINRNWSYVHANWQKCPQLCDGFILGKGDEVSWSLAYVWLVQLDRDMKEMSLIV